MPVRMVTGRPLTWWQKAGVVATLLATVLLGLLFFAVLLGLFAALAVIGGSWILWKRWRLRSDKVRKDGTLRAEYRIIQQEDSGRRRDQ
ncbi:MAG: hypothetical protein U7M05_03150 [Candidatus Igneacidithiobacillus chanchocoensis]